MYLRKLVGNVNIVIEGVEIRARVYSFRYRDDMKRGDVVEYRFDSCDKMISVGNSVLQEAIVTGLQAMLRAM